MSSPNPSQQERAEDPASKAGHAGEQHTPNHSHRGITPTWSFQNARQVTISTRPTGSLVLSARS